MSAAPNHFFEFGSYRLIPAERLLLRDNVPISLPPKAFDTLVILVENSGQVVRKDTLIDRLWPNAFVEENNLNQCVSSLRRALTDGQNGPDYIETVRGFGYRFRAMVRASAEENETLVHRRQRTHIVLREEAIEHFKETRVAGEPNATHPQEGTIATKTHRAVFAPRLMFAMVAATVVLGGLLATYFANKSQSAAGNTTAGSSARGGMSNNPEAMAAYARGREFWNKRTKEDMVKAQHEFQSALVLDPRFAAAYAGLADCLLLGGNLPFSSESSETLANKALAIDETCAEAHTSLAYYKGAVEWDWKGAEFHFRRAIELNPQYATARHWHAYNLASLGRMDESLAEIREAHRLDMASTPIATDMGHMLYFAKRYDEAIAQYRSVLERSPDFSQARLRLAEAYVQKQRWDDALAELEEVDKLGKHHIPAWFAYTYALANRRADAIRILNRLKRDAELMRRTWDVATIYASLGDKDSAFAWLEKTLVNHEGNLALLKVDPVLDSLRDDPRYSDLLRRINLE